MSARKSKLDQLKVVTPCSSNWEQMTGNHKKRFCSECDKHVFDFSQMTRQQIEAVTAVNHGNLCARITRREDGSLVMLNAPLPVYSSRRLNSPMLSAAVATVLSLGVPATAQPVTIQQGRVVTQSKDKQKNNDGKSEAGAVSSVSGTVFDLQQAVVANAIVKLVAPNSTPLITHSSSDGTFQFTGVEPGTYTLMTESPGFRLSILSDVRVVTSTETQVTVTLDVMATEMLGGAVAVTPATLLNLYHGSELIAIVTVGKSKAVKTEEGSKQFQTALHISSILKGDAHQRVVPFYHWVSEETSDEIKPGDRLLVFLDQRRSEDDKPIDGFEVNDWSHSIRKLNDSELGVYRLRIEELNSILSVEQPNQHELIEWLIRCIEEPVTRWDGALELEQEVSLLESLNEETKYDEKTKQPHQSVTAEISQDAETAKAKDEESNKEDNASDRLYSLMSAEQKARVSKVLFSIDELSNEDMLLVSLVREWDGQRLAFYLAAQLQKMIAEAPPLAEEIVLRLAELIDDESVQEAADAYLDGIEYDASEYEPDEETDQSRKPKTVAAQIAISKRSTKLTAFLAVVSQKLNH